MLLPLLWACQAGDAAPGLLGEVAGPTAVATVFEVTWPSEGSGVTALVEHGPPEDCGRWRTPEVAAELGATLVVGHGPDAEVCWRLRLGGAREAVGDWRRTRTEPLPAGVPRVTAEIVDERAADDAVFAVGNGTAPSSALVIDRSGTVLWYQLPLQDHLSPQAGEVPGGAGIRLFRFHRDFTEHAVLLDVGWDGAELGRVVAAEGHHAAAWTDDGTVAWLARDLRETPEWGPVIGDAVVVRSPTGGERSVWSTWDDLPVEPHDDWESTFYPDGRDWTHANYLAWDADRATWTVSMRNADTVVEVDAEGTWLRGLGTWGDVPTTPPDLLGYPHTARWLDEGRLMLFTTPGREEDSRGVELAVGEEAAVAWSYGEGLGRFTRVLGEAVTDGSSRRVGFGSGGPVEEVGPDGAVWWRLDGEQPDFFPGHVTRLADFPRLDP